MHRGDLQISLLGILAAALLLSSGIAAFLIYSDNPRFVAACLDVRHAPGGTLAQQLSEAAQASEHRLCLRDIAGTVGNTVGTAFGPLLVIMLSVIFMHKTARDDVLDRRQSIIALVIFCSLQIVAVVVLSLSVALTPNLLDLRPDALQNAIYTAVQGIVVAFAFPRGATPTSPPS